MPRIWLCLIEAGLNFGVFRVHQNHQRIVANCSGPCSTSELEYASAWMAQHSRASGQFMCRAIAGIAPDHIDMVGAQQAACSAAAGQGQRQVAQGVG